MKRKLVVLLAMLMLMLAVAAPAFAGPKFGTCAARLDHVVATGHGTVPPPCPFSLP